MIQQMENVLMEGESSSMGGADQVLNLQWEFSHWLNATGTGQLKTDFQHLIHLFYIIAQRGHKLKKKKKPSIKTKIRF